MNHAALNEVVYEKDFASTVFTHRAFLFYGAAAKSMEIECKTRDLPFTRGGFIVMMVDTVLSQIMDWVNGSIRLRDDGTEPLSKADMFQYLAVMLFLTPLV